VAKLEGLQPYEAAKLIAEKFNLPLDEEPTAEEKRQLYEQNNKRNLKKIYEEIENKAFLNLVAFKELASIVWQNNVFEIPDKLLPAMHLLPQVEYYIQVLIDGTVDERLFLLREGVLVKWANLK